MKSRQRGFMVVEMAVATAIIGIVAAITGTLVFQTVKSTEVNSSHATAVFQLIKAGYWISNDTLMAESVSTDNLEYPNVLVLAWTVRNYQTGSSVYHSVTYYIDELSNNIGKLKRHRWSSTGLDDDSTIASYIYYNPGDLEHTSKASSQFSTLTVQLNATVGGATEMREYKVKHRPTFAY